MFTLHSSERVMWGAAMMILWMFQFVVIISGQDSGEDVEVWKFRDGEPANLTVLGDIGNGCKFVLQTDEDRTCCYMNQEAQKDLKNISPEYNICGDQQSEDCISKTRFSVRELKGPGRCILTLNNFQKSDAGMYNVEFPNERRKKIKKIEILERKFEIKEIVGGQTAIAVFKGDIREEGCRFEAHLSSGTCCYEGKRRQSCKQEKKCPDYRNSSSYEVWENGNKCVLYLYNFQTSHVGEYEVIFPGDKDDNETFKIKEAEVEKYVQIRKFRDGEPANLTVLGDTGNGCKFVLQTDEDRTCCYMNQEAQKDPDYNICRDQQSEECISKKRFEVSEPKGQGKCILTLKNFKKSDAGVYIVEFPNESNPSNRRKFIEIQERKTETKEIVLGQTAVAVFKGDIKKRRLQVYGISFSTFLLL